MAGWMFARSSPVRDDFAHSGLGEVEITGGFWAGRQEVHSTATIAHEERDWPYHGRDDWSDAGHETGIPLGRTTSGRT